MAEIKYPDCTVTLLGEDSNIFLIIGRVRVALRAHMKERGVETAERERRLDEFGLEVMSARSYDDALAVVMRWVDVG